jgi:hypothetical protein
MALHLLFCCFLSRRYGQTNFVWHYTDRYFSNLLELKKFIFYALRKTFITAIFGNGSQKVGLALFEASP